jgi:hypothetical protein
LIKRSSNVLIYDCIESYENDQKARNAVVKELTIFKKGVEEILNEYKYIRIVFNDETKNAMRLRFMCLFRQSVNGYEEDVKQINDKLIVDKFEVQLIKAMNIWIENIEFCTIKKELVCIITSLMILRPLFGCVENCHYWRF